MIHAVIEEEEAVHECHEIGDAAVDNQCIQISSVAWHTTCAPEVVSPQQVVSPQHHGPSGC